MVPNVKPETNSKPVSVVGHDIRLPVIAILTVLTLAAGRLAMAVHRYSVNLVFWDQWDFYTPLFNRASLWQVFTWEHAPHREGIGLVLDKFVLEWTHWNSEAEALFMVGALFAAAIVMLVLKQRLFGRLEYSDCVIPCLLLTFAQLEALVGQPNPSYSVFPELLIGLFCLAWMIRSRIARYGCLLILNFLLIYTGFGIFMGIVTAGVFGLELRRSIRRKSESPSESPIVAAAALALAAASMASFFYHYHWNPDVSCPISGHHPLTYPWFVGLLMSYFLGLRSVVVASVVGSVVALVMLSIFLWHSIRLWRNKDWSPIDLTIVILLGFSLLFAANAAAGRSCQGMPEAAQFSRYMGLLVPAFLAIYFHLLTLPKGRGSTMLTAVFLMSVIPGIFMIPSGYSPQAVHDGKVAWKTCIRQVGDIDYCDRVTGFPAYPVPRRAHLLEKLQFLQRGHLNLYSDNR